MSRRPTRRGVPGAASALVLGASLIVAACDRGSTPDQPPSAASEVGAESPSDGSESVDAQAAERADHEDRWALAERQIVRLGLEAFPELPEHVRSEVEREECLVPQSPSVPGPHNVVRGRFAHPGQEDWAVLCSSGAEHRIVVVWGGSHTCPAGLGEGPLRGLLQGSGGGIEYSRLLTVAEPERILRAHADYEAHGAPAPPDPLTHQGIEDAFLGKASVIWYCEGGEWLRLQGAD